MCVCVRERGRERSREVERSRGREVERERERERESVCVCVCARAFVRAKQALHTCCSSLGCCQYLKNTMTDHLSMYTLLKTTCESKRERDAGE